MKFIKMMDSLEVQLNKDKTFIDRFKDEKIFKTKKFKRALRIRDYWMNLFCQTKDVVLRTEIDKNLSRCDMYLDRLICNGYSYNELKKKYGCIV